MHSFSDHETPPVHSTGLSPAQDHSQCFLRDQEELAPLLWLWSRQELLCANPACWWAIVAHLWIDLWTSLYEVSQCFVVLSLHFLYFWFKFFNVFSFNWKGSACNPPKTTTLFAFKSLYQAEIILLIILYSVNLVNILIGKNSLCIWSLSRKWVVLIIEVNVHRLKSNCVTIELLFYFLFCCSLLTYYTLSVIKIIVSCSSSILKQHPTFIWGQGEYLCSCSHHLLSVVLLSSLICSLQINHFVSGSWYW